MAMAKTKAVEAHLRMLIASMEAGSGSAREGHGAEGGMETGEQAQVQVQVVFYATQAATTGTKTATARDTASQVGNELTWPKARFRPGPLSHAHIVYLKQKATQRTSAIAFKVFAS